MAVFFPRTLVSTSAAWLAALAAPSLAWSAVPEATVYIGYLTTAEGGTPYDGTIDLQATLHLAEEGSDEPVWTSEPILALPVDGGVFTALLSQGGPTTLTEAFLAGATWLELTIDGEPMLPRHRVVSAPYALVAGVAEHASTADSASQLDGLTASDLVTQQGLAALDLASTGWVTAQGFATSTQLDGALAAANAYTDAAVKAVSPIPGGGTFALSNQLERWSRGSPASISADISTHDLAYVNDILFAFDTRSSTNLWLEYSTDGGMSFTPIIIKTGLDPAESSTTRDIDYDGTNYVLIALLDSSAQAYRKSSLTDGWTSLSGSTSLGAVAWNAAAGQWLRMGSSTTYLTSADAITWTSQTGPSQFGQGTSTVAYGLFVLNGKFVILDGYRVFHSDTGLTGSWTTVDLSAHVDKLNAATYADGRYVLLGESNDDPHFPSLTVVRALTTTDLVDWTSATAVDHRYRDSYDDVQVRIFPTGGHIYAAARSNLPGFGTNVAVLQLMPDLTPVPGASPHVIGRSIILEPTGLTTILPGGAAAWTGSALYFPNGYFTRAILPTP